MYACIGKNIIYIGFGTILVLGNHWSSWNVSPADKRGLTTIWEKEGLANGFKL